MSLQDNQQKKLFDILKSPLGFYVVFLLFLLCIASKIAVYDDQQGALSLSCLTPLIDGLMPISQYIALHSREIINISGMCFSGLILILGFLPFSRQTLIFPRLILVAFAASIVAQLCLLRKWHDYGAALYIIAFLLTLLCATRKGEPQANRLVEDLEEKTKRFDLYDFITLSFITLIAVILRFYALNRVVNYFEGEAAVFSAAGTDLHGMLRAAVGEGGPWSPFGYVYFLSVYVTTKLFGTTVLALRLMSAIISVITIALFYCLLRVFKNRDAAKFSALVMAIDPLQLSWARSDIFPHGSTTWIALIICWLAFRAANSKSTIYLLALSIFVGLSFHQYPSGQVAFLIPICFFFWNLLFDRSYRILTHANRIFFAALGFGLWIFGFRLQYFLAYGNWNAPSFSTMFGARTAWSNNSSPLSTFDSILKILNTCWLNIYDLVKSLCIALPFPLPPQCYFTHFPDLSLRTVLWIVPPLAFVAAFKALIKPKWKAGTLLLFWALCGILPAIFSVSAMPRRSAIFFPALFALAACSYGTIKQLVTSILGKASSYLLLCFEVIIAVSLLFSSIFQLFSGKNYIYGEPFESELAKNIESILEPRAIVIFDSEDGYYLGKITYLMLDILKKGSVKPIAWYTISPFILTHLNFESLIVDPNKAVQVLDKTLPYQWTSLREDLASVMANNNWEKVIFISQSWPTHNSPSVVEERFEKAGLACPSGEFFNFDEKAQVRRKVRALKCSVSNLVKK